MAGSTPRAAVGGCAHLCAAAVAASQAMNEGFAREIVLLVQAMSRAAHTLYATADAALASRDDPRAASRTVCRRDAREGKGPGGGEGGGSR